MAGYAATGWVPAREFYEQVDWSIIVMLACLLALGEAFGMVGGAGLTVSFILGATHRLPTETALVLLVLATMVIAGPVAIALASRHKNNTLMMEPNGYAFGDYWRLGLTMHIIVLAVSVPIL
ncbi:MAG: hypothetical protein EXR09_05085 [Acetobacteraceae bacterium]|nr:hypothetical protein [Acetobacteraceae bacterium]